MYSTLLMILETLVASGPALTTIFVAALILGAALIAATLGHLADPEPFPSSLADSPAAQTGTHSLRSAVY